MAAWALSTCNEGSDRGGDLLPERPGFVEAPVQEESRNPEYQVL